MESRGRRPRSPQLQRTAARKVPVVYYITRSRHLEHPHFVEVPVSSQEGLYLRDVINHLNMVRGKGMAAMYTWSCKRSYKNGFVWHDLAEDDLVLPAADGEYVLKGCELLDQPSSGQFYHGSDGNQKQQGRLKEGARLPLPREVSYSSSPPSVIVREAKPLRLPSVPLRDEDDSPLPCMVNSLESMSPASEPQRTLLSRAGSTSPAEFRVYKPTGSMDAATQTDDLGRRSVQKAPEMHGKSLNTNHDSVVCEITECRQSHPRRSSELQGISKEVMSQCGTPLSVPSTRGKSKSLESLIQADDNAMNSFRILEEDDIVVPTCPKLRPTNLLMQLITCGSLSVKDPDNIRLVEAYKPRFPNLKFPSLLISRTMMMGELDYLSENPRFMGMQLEDKEYFSGSLIEMQRDVPAERDSVLKRSSSYNAERSSETLDCARPDEDTVNSSRSRCLPRTPILSSFLHPKSEMLKSPVSDCRSSSSAGPDCSLASGDGSKRFTDASGASARLDSFSKDKERLVKIEERLSSGARVVIQYIVPCTDSDEG